MHDPIPIIEEPEKPVVSELRMLRREMQTLATFRLWARALEVLLLGLILWRIW
jgi:hypothetical protein